MSNFTAGDVTGSQILTPVDHFYETLINELRQSFPVSATVGTTTDCEYYCDGTADDIEINAALLAATGGKVTLKKGTYSLSDCIRVPDNTILEGEGWGTILKYADNTVNSSIAADAQIRAGVIRVLSDTYPTPGWATGYNIILRNFKLDCNRAGQTSLIANNLYGVFFIWSSNCRIENIWVINALSSGIGIWPSNSTPAVHAETVITGCRTENNNVSIAEGGQGLDAGIFISNGTSLPVRVMISNCISIGNYNGFCIEDSNGGVSFSNCQAFENMNDGFCLVTAYGSHFSNCYSLDNVRDGFGCNGAGERFISLSNCISRGNRYGIRPGHDWNITGGHIYYNDECGIYLSGTNNLVNGVWVGRNGKGTTPTLPYGIYATLGDSGSQNSVIGCHIGASIGADSVPETQTYGIFEDTTALDNLYADNVFYTPAATANINKGASSISRIRNNYGWVTENSGTIAVASGKTAGTVTHGLAVTPTADDISITPINTMGSATTFYTNGYGASTFVINVNTDPGATTAQFAWKAIVL